MVLNLIMIFIGFVLLIKGADFLVDGASEIAKRFHIPEIVIGLTIVAIGTSMPELVVSVTSALEGHSDLAIGNVIGSNIANLFLILGVCSIIKPLLIKRETRIFEIPFTIITTAVLFYFCINKLCGKENIIFLEEGVILLVLCVLFLIYNLIMAKKGEEFDKEDLVVELKVDNNNVPLYESIFGVVMGIIGLKLGGDFVVDHSVQIAQILGISEKLIGLTIVAFSTSLPELITSITATRKGETDMAIGNILGSQIFNIVLIIGVSAVLSSITYSLSYNSNLLLLIMGTIFLGLFPYIGKKNVMSRSNGILFVILYAIYMVSIVVMG